MGKFKELEGLGEVTPCDLLATRVASNALIQKKLAQTMAQVRLMARRDHKELVEALQGDRQAFVEAVRDGVTHALAMGGPALDEPAQAPELLKGGKYGA